MMMKISKCKKELARIISEHGGWFYGAEWASQDKIGVEAVADEIAFYEERPSYKSGSDMWNANKPSDTVKHSFPSGGLLKNWHQAILSREEYFHLYPAPDADGWIEWKGGECPVDVDAFVCCKWRSGKVSITAHRAGCLSWRHNGNAADIIAYRLCKPERVEIAEYNYSGVVYTGPVKSEFVVDEKQTLDKLLKEWRNADDFAQRKQAEADEAAAMRCERWEAVQARAGEIGVTVCRKI